LTAAFEGREKELCEYKKKFNVSMPILIDENGSLAKAYKVRGTMKLSSLTVKERSSAKHTLKRIGHRQP
jgi:peroxiredoxin